jgi:hypothetical protein
MTTFDRKDQFYSKLSFNLENSISKILLPDLNYSFFEFIGIFSNKSKTRPGKNTFFYKILFKKI